MMVFSKKNTNPFLLRKEVRAFLPKETVREKKKCTSYMKNLLKISTRSRVFKTAEITDGRMSLLHFSHYSH